MSEEQIPMKSGQEIVDYVVRWFSTHPRSMHGGECRHITGKRRCAFALICNDDPDTNKELKRLEGSSCFDGRLRSREVWGGFLRPEFRGHEPRFYRDLQVLHDGDVYWVEKNPSAEVRTLSSAGITQAARTVSQASF